MEKVDAAYKLYSGIELIPLVVRRAVSAPFKFLLERALYSKNQITRISAYIGFELLLLIPSLPLGVVLLTGKPQEVEGTLEALKVYQDPGVIIKSAIFLPIIAYITDLISKSLISREIPSDIIPSNTPEQPPPPSSCSPD